MKLSKSFPVVTDIDRLHTVSKAIDLNDKKLQTLVRNELFRTFIRLNAKAQGLAAIQCDQPYRAILLRFYKDKQPDVVFNPEIIFKCGSVKSNEGCVSEGDKRYIVQRPIVSIVRYYDGDTTKTRVYGYRKSRIFMHECDHLDGILLQDKGVPVEG